MITFLHVPEASEKTPGDGRLNGRSFTCICGENMDDNLFVYCKGESVIGYFGGQFKEVADGYRFMS